MTDYDTLSHEEWTDRQLIQKQAAIEIWDRARRLYAAALSLQNAQQLSGRKFTYEEARQVREVMRMIGEMMALDVERNG